MSGGYQTGKHGITQISNSAGKVLYDYAKDAPKPKKIIEDQAIAALNLMLSQVPEWGTGRRAALDGIKTAGKTGTTSAYKDAWFVVYTGNYVAAVWFGNDNFLPTRRLTGGNLPAKTWKKFMTYAHQNIDIKPIPFLENQKVASKTKGKKSRWKIANAADAPVLGVRQKPLPEATSTVLRDIEKSLRSAKRLAIPDKLAQISIEGDSKNQTPTGSRGRVASQ
jgi:penicillin-binding protein 1A